MTDFIVLPGIGGSDDHHWQTLWEADNKAMRRFAPASWDAPDFTNWMAALELAVATAPSPPVLIAHSLSCLLVAHWQRKSGLPIKGAFLVAVPDPASPPFPAAAHAFASAPRERFRFPCLIIASSDDPYGSLDYAQARAAQWGGDCRLVGALGHISSGSNLGRWPEGLAMLTAFQSACL